MSCGEPNSQMKGREKMNANLRMTILVGATFGVLALGACTTERTTTAPPVTATVAEPVIAQEGSAAIERCPLDQGALRDICRRMNARTSGLRTVDYFLPRNLSPGEPFIMCPCPGVTICASGDAACPRIAGRNFIDHDVIYGAVVQGSHCEELCTSTTGGGGTKYTKCVRACKAQH